MKNIAKNPKQSLIWGSLILFACLGLLPHIAKSFDVTDDLFVKSGYIGGVYYNGHATVDGSISAGNNDLYYAYNSAMFGYNNTPYYSSLLVGDNNSGVDYVNWTHTSDRSLAVGSSNQLNGSSLATVGTLNIVDASNTVALGKELTAKSYASVVIGQHNEVLPEEANSQSRWTWETEDPVFVIGVGNGVSGDPDEKKNALVVYKDGRVTIPNPSGIPMYNGGN